MSKKHFIELAKQIATIKGKAARESAANAVANACKEFNPNFDVDRFLKACGV
jgi:hypothetical protein